MCSSHGGGCSAAVAAEPGVGATGCGAAPLRAVPITASPHSSGCISAPCKVKGSLSGLSSSLTGGFVGDLALGLGRDCVLMCPHSGF